MVITVRKLLDTGEVGAVCGNLGFSVIDTPAQRRVGGLTCSGFSIDTPTKSRVSSPACSGLGIDTTAQRSVGCLTCSGFSIDTPAQCSVGCLTGSGFSIDAPTQRSVSCFTVGNLLGKVIGQHLVSGLALGGLLFEDCVQLGVTGGTLVLFVLQRGINSNDGLGFPACGCEVGGLFRVIKAESIVLCVRHGNSLVFDCAAEGGPAMR